MSPLDQSKEVPNLKEDGEGSVQVKMDPDMKIDGAKVFAVYGKGGPLYRRLQKLSHHLSSYLDPF